VGLDLIFHEKSECYFQCRKVISDMLFLIIMAFFCSFAYIIPILIGVIFLRFRKHKKFKSLRFVCAFLAVTYVVILIVFLWNPIVKKDDFVLFLPIIGLLGVIFLWTPTVLPVIYSKYFKKKNLQFLVFLFIEIFLSAVPTILLILDFFHLII
jgi:hypothetical protein